MSEQKKKAPLPVYEAGEKVHVTVLPYGKTVTVCELVPDPDIGFQYMLDDGGEKIGPFPPYMLAKA